MCLQDVTLSEFCAWKDFTLLQPSLLPHLPKWWPNQAVLCHCHLLRALGGTKARNWA